MPWNEAGHARQRYIHESGRLRRFGRYMLRILQFCRRRYTRKKLIHSLNETSEKSLCRSCFNIHAAHEDPRTMDRNDFCYTCYDSGTKLTCGGNLLRKKVVRDKSSWVTAKSCIDMYGMCCMGNATSGMVFYFLKYK